MSVDDLVVTTSGWSRLPTQIVRDEQPIPKPIIRQFGREETRWICYAMCAPYHCFVVRPGYGPTERAAYAAWLDANALCHEDFKEAGC